MPEFTTVVAVDAEHLTELDAVWPTWQRWHPELFENIQFLRDPDGVGWPVDAGLTKLMGTPYNLGPYADEGVSNRRDRMLGGLLTVVPATIDTPYWLKIDTDTIATGEGPPLTQFVTDDIKSIAAPGWSYTTPRDSLFRLDAWYQAATGQPPLWESVVLGPNADNGDRKAAQRAGKVVYTPHWHRRAKDRAWFPRIIGWLSIINTEFSRRVADFLVQYPPPFISHDTLLWYLAERWNMPTKSIKFQQHGWDHRLGIRSIRERVTEVMGWEQQTQFARRQGESHTVTVAAAETPPATVTTTSPDPVLPFATVAGRPLPPPQHDAIRGDPAGSLLTILQSHFGTDSRLIGAEIGVHRGQTSSWILHHLPNLTLVMVDPWIEWEDKSQLRRDRITGADQSAMNGWRSEAYQITEPYRARRVIVERPSVDACELFRPEMFDWIFVDAMHTYEAAKADAECWWTRLRPGGLFCGHDYNHRGFPGVTQAVNEFAATVGKEVQSHRKKIWSFVK